MPTRDGTGEDSPAQAAGASSRVLFAGSKYCSAGGEIRAARFANDRIALVVASGPGWHRLTVNIPDEAPLDADEVAIRDYSSGEGTLGALVSSGVVAPPHRYFRDVDGGGHVTFPICRLLVSPRPL